MLRLYNPTHVPASCPGCKAAPFRTAVCGAIDQVQEHAYYECGAHLFWRADRDEIVTHLTCPRQVAAAAEPASRSRRRAGSRMEMR